MSGPVAQVVAGQLDPSWLGLLFEVVEDTTRDGPARTGFRLRGYTVPDGGRVRLVTETSTLVVEPDTVLHCYAPAEGLAGRGLGPGSASAVAPVVVGGVAPDPVGWPAAGPPPPVTGYRPASASVAPAPGPEGPEGAAVRPGIVPAGPPPWAQPGGGWAQPGGGQ